MKKIQIGTELEYEVDGSNSLAMSDLYSKKNPLISSIKYDCSLDNGIEINTIYTNLSGWKIKEIKELMNLLKAYNANNNTHTAGQHIHLSGLAQGLVFSRMSNFCDAIENFLYPISGRYRRLVYPSGRTYAAHYGLGKDMWRYNSEYGTIEIRAFASTTNATTIKNRMIVVRELYKFLATNKPISDLFNSLTKKGKKAYKALLQDKSNPHEFGDSVEVMLQKL